MVLRRRQQLHTSCLHAVRRSCYDGPMARPATDLIAALQSAPDPSEEGGIVALVIPVETYKEFSDKAAAKGMTFNQLLISALTQVLKEET